MSFSRSSMALALAQVLALTLVLPAPAASPAELLPADSLAYFELVKPGEAAGDLGQLTKGSVLDDFDAWLKKIGTATRFDYFNGTASDGTIEAIALMFGPEMRAEAKRFQGGAVALTGIDRLHRPHLVAVLLTGDSQVPVLGLKAFLSGSAAGKKVATVEGVSLYRQTQSVATFNPWNNQFGLAGWGGFPARGGGFFGGVPGGMAFDPTVASDGFGPVYAYMPGLIVAGSDIDTVGDVVRRHKGRLKRADFTSNTAYKETAALRERAGVYACIEVARITEHFDKARRACGDGEPIHDAFLREVFNPKAVPTLCASLSLKDGVTDLELVARLDPKERSPLLDLIGAGDLGAKLLKNVPGDRTGSATIRLPDAGRFEKLLAVADALARASGELGMTPSEALPDLDKHLGKSLAKEVGDRVTAITLLPPPAGEMPASAMRLPGILLHTDSAASAESLGNLLPGICEFVSGRKVQPAKEKVGNVMVYTLAGGGTPWGTPLHFAQSGPSLVVSQDRARVLAALDTKQAGGILADTRIAASLADRKAVSAFGVWQWGEMLDAACRAAAKSIEESPVPETGIIPVIPEMTEPDPFTEPIRWLRKIAGFKEPDPESPDAVMKREQDSEAKGWKELGAACKALPPALTIIERTPTELRVNIRQVGLPTVAPKGIDRTLEWYRKRSSLPTDLEILNEGMMIQKD